MLRKRLSVSVASSGRNETRRKRTLQIVLIEQRLFRRASECGADVSIIRAWSDARQVFLGARRSLHRKQSSNVRWEIHHAERKPYV